MFDIENLIKIIEKNFETKGLKISKSKFLRSDCVLIKKGGLEVEMFYSTSHRKGDDFPEDEISVSWTRKEKGEWGGGIYGRILSEEPEESIVKDAISHFFNLKPIEHKLIQTTIFDFI